MTLCASLNYSTKTSMFSYIHTHTHTNMHIYSALTSTLLVALHYTNLAVMHAVIRVCVYMCTSVLTGKLGPSRPDMPLPPLPTEARPSGGGGGGRVDMPLPPLPTTSSSTSPPLPQRTSAGQQTSHPTPSPAQPPSSTSSSSSHDPLTNSYPPLPPRNPRANGGSTSPVPGQGSSPPEPVRGAPPSSSASSAPRGREECIMDLVGLGYSRSDVVRALSVARNDFNIAKSILKEFGGRI